MHTHHPDESPIQILRRVFGYPQFRPAQQDAIQGLLDGKDTVVLMPTGGGKSLCYQIPAIAKPGYALVISPLISLMHDQVIGLQQLGVSAAVLNSSLSASEAQQVYRNWLNHRLKLLYVAPERLFMPDFFNTLCQFPPHLIAIDEAHCISEWGHDFRPEYQQLHILKTQFSSVPIMALTATATEAVLTDIKRHLKLINPTQVKIGYNRPNLFYEIRPKQDTFKQILAFIRTRPTDSGIIYCQSRAQVESVTQKLCQAGIVAKPYHAGLSDVIRHQNQSAFTFGQIPVIVATVAFGMGINKPDVRYVIHHDLPKTIEHYYQETGRAGRDGADSHCLLFFSYADKHKYASFMDEISDATEKKKAKRKLDQMVQFATTPFCRRKQLLSYFGEHTDIENCGKCDVCINPPMHRDITVLSQQILSCIYRTGQRFGSGLVIAVLRGQNTDRIRQLRFEHLSVFGLCRDHSEAELKDAIQYLAHIDAIAVQGNEYPILTLTSLARDIFKGVTPIHMPVYVKPKSTHSRKKASSDSPSTVPNSLFVLLREKRKELAELRGVPAYVIFHDTTLRDMAQVQPETQAELLNVSGIGVIKAEQFGDVFLSVIRAWKSTH